jgi:hypothetical protein
VRAEARKLRAVTLHEHAVMPLDQASGNGCSGRPTSKHHHENEEISAKCTVYLQPYSRPFELVYSQNFEFHSRAHLTCENDCIR